MYTGLEALQHYVNGDKGHLIIKKNELHFVRKVGFFLHFKASLGFGNAAKRNVVAFINKNRNVLFSSNAEREVFNTKLDAYNKKRLAWWKKASKIQDLTIQNISQAAKVSAKGSSRPASMELPPPPPLSPLPKENEPSPSTSQQLPPPPPPYVGKVPPPPPPKRELPSVSNNQVKKPKSPQQSFHIASDILNDQKMRLKPISASKPNIQKT